MSSDISPLEKAKEWAAHKAIDEQVNQDTHVLGIGSGSTIVYAVERLGQRFREEKLPIRACIASSFQAEQLIIDNGLPLASLNEYPEIDVSFDGADEVDPQLNCIKGGGACLLREKLLISNAKRFYIIGDDRKDSQVLGTKWTQGVPLEVVPLCYKAIMNKVSALGGKPTLRMAVRKAGPVVTDHGNFIIDADFGELENPSEMHNKLITIPGIVETGLFCGFANGVYFGSSDGQVKVVMSQKQ